jgi:hypothetical protein
MRLLPDKEQQRKPILKQLSLKHKPIIFTWIKQYEHKNQRICDLCAKKSHGKKYFASYRLENYFDLMNVLEHLSSPVFSIDHLDNAVWNTLIREQTEGLPQLKREDFCCTECTSLQINLFMNEETIAQQVLAIPKLNKGNPIAALISWVLLKPASDQDKPSLIFTESNNPMEVVIQQAEGILKSGKMHPAANWPK